MNGRDLSRPGLLYWLAFAVALALRLAWLDLRPLHHDEALNASLLLELVTGSGYRYNPQAYHGPALYLLGWLPGEVLGLGTVALRLPVALASASTILLLLPLRRRLGRAGITGAAWLLALSPSLVFYGRDLIHETYLVVATLGLVVAGSLWLESRRRLHLLVAAGSLALLFTIKETAPLTVISLAAACAIVGGSKPPLPNRRELAWAGLAFALVWIAAFTTLFTHLSGLADSLLAYLPWLRKGVGGALHEKPWTYFPRLLWSFEAPVLLGASGAGALALRRLVRARDESRAEDGEGKREDRFTLFCFLWAGFELALYSAIPYKTPWLMINMVAPGALAAGALLRDGSLAGFPASARRGLAALFVVGLGWSAWRACDASFRRYDDPAIGLVYSDTRREMLGLLALVRREAALHSDPGRPLLEAYLPSRWPLRWYLRDLAGTRWSRRVERPPVAHLVIADRAHEATLRPLLAQGYTRQEFLLRPDYAVSVWIRKLPR